MKNYSAEDPRGSLVNGEESSLIKTLKFNKQVLDF